MFYYLEHVSDILLIVIIIIIIIIIIIRCHPNLHNILCNITIENNTTTLISDPKNQKIFFVKLCFPSIFSCLNIHKRLTRNRELPLINCGQFSNFLRSRFLSFATVTLSQIPKFPQAPLCYSPFIIHNFSYTLFVAVVRTKSTQEN